MIDEPLTSVVIPVWRDARALARTLERLNAPDGVEVIVATALDDESSYRAERDRFPCVRWTSAPRGRAVQMNAGAALARGRWIVFLHADSELPADWPTVIATLERRRDVAAGAFRLALDSERWWARLVEAGVRLRVAILGLPYGDQALFVRSSVFTAVGGYHDLPLMEDIDFVRRVRRAGRMFQARQAVLTSPRRWERDGWMRRSMQNMSLATRFSLGASPSRLAQRYFGRKATAIVMMARAPWTGGKTRLCANATEGAHADLRRALFLDTLEVMTSIPGIEHLIACEPANSCEQLRDLAGTAVDVIAQRGDDLGQRLVHVFEDAFRLGVESVIVIGSDLPDLPSRLLREALNVLRAREDRVVVGPATDGGYYLIGMNRLHTSLFERIEWSSPRVLSQTLAAATAAGLDVVLLEPWTDVDDAASLSGIVAESSPVTASRTRAWCIEHMADCWTPGCTRCKSSDARRTSI